MVAEPIASGREAIERVEEGDEVTYKNEDNPPVNSHSKSFGRKFEPRDQVKSEKRWNFTVFVAGDI
jgi:hypothetical protein